MLKNRWLLIGAACLLGAFSVVRAVETAARHDDAPALPRLVDLGAGKCIPCKLMKPILDELKRDYADQFEVVFIDVWENREAGYQYGIRVIPTQIFYDANGKELYRHEGFLAKDAILARWRELGVEVPARVNSESDPESTSG